MFTSILDSVMHESSVEPITSAYNGFVASLGNFYPFIVIALCLFVGLFGRRISGFIRVCLLFAVGFVSSVYWLAPLVQQFVPQIPAVGIGVAVGLFAAVMSRMIYNLVYVGCIGVDVFNICFNALFLVELTSLVKDNLVVCLAIAAGATVLALLARKYLEMIITAVAGGIGVAYFADQIVPFSSSIGIDPMTTIVLAGILVAVPMFCYQYYNRVIY